MSVFTSRSTWPPRIVTTSYRDTTHDQTTASRPRGQANESTAIKCPPFSDLRPWIEKAWAEPRAQLSVLLLPANRTEQTWWQDLIESRRDRVGSPLRTEFLRGRMRFIASGEDRVYPNMRPPFGCVLCIWQWPLHRPLHPKSARLLGQKPTNS
jgi:hypothetical protein